MATRKVVNKNVSTGSQLTLSKHYVEQVTKLHIVSRFFNAGQHGNQRTQCWNFFGLYLWSESPPKYNASSDPHTLPL